MHILGLVSECLLYFRYGLGSEMDKEDLDRGFDTELSDDRVQMPNWYHRCCRGKVDGVLRKMFVG